jgi:hypothetical protein
VEAGPEAVWRGLARYWGGPGARVASAGTRLLGCRETSSRGSLDQAGSTVAGFRVDRAERPRVLALEGRHRFARYRLTFQIDDLGGGRSRLTATSDADFPGAAGRVYRALVIGTRGHVVAVRRMLATIARHAVRSGATSA